MLVAASILFFMAGVLWWSRSPVAWKLAWLLMAAGGLVVCAEIAMKWISLERPPFKNLDETYVLLALCTVVIGAVAGRLTGVRFFSSAVSLISAGLLLLPFFSENGLASPLPPALQSLWFVPHVTAFFTGYGALLLASVAGGAFMYSRKAEAARLADRLALVAFVFFSAGLCLGALWAQDAWGTWWGWDPKESMALGSWLLMASHRHMPSSQRQGALGMAVIFAACAIAAVTYLFMHMLPSAGLSMHVYSRL